MLDIMVDCYLQHNLGDDLFLYTLLERYEGLRDVRFHIWADSSYSFLHQRYRNLCLHQLQSATGGLPGRFEKWRRNMTARRRTLASADASVQIGGSIFPENRGVGFHQWVKDRYRLRTWSRELYAVPRASFVIGSNFGLESSMGSSR